MDYEREYSAGLQPFGPPIPEFQRFFGEFEGENTRVLDLGCGQGRDALLAAARGAEVIGIDKSPSGVRQMVEAGQRDGLRIQGNVGDVLTFEPPGMFDVVILGYVLHTLANDEERWGSRGLFQSALRKVEPGGHILVSETPGNTIDVFGLLSNGKHGRWEVTVKTNNCVIARRSHL